MHMGRAHRLKDLRWSELLHLPHDHIAGLRPCLPLCSPSLRGTHRARPFFIIGSGRSGNTLLRRILQASPELHIPPESYVLGPVIKAFRRHRKARWNDLVTLVAGAFELHPEFGAFGIHLRELMPHLRSAAKSERNLAHGLSEVSRIVSALDVSDVIDDQACDLFRSAQSEDLFHGRSIEAMAAGNVYAACRCNRLPWTLDEVSAVARVNKERVENAYRALNRELGLPTVPPSPQQYVPRLVSELGVSQEVRQVAERLAKKAENHRLANGRNPVGVAAGCLYEATQRRSECVTQCELGACADVSPKTVRDRWRELKQIE